MNPFVSKQTDESFNQGERRDRPMVVSPPSRAVTAAELEEAMAAVEFPKSKAEIVAFASRQTPMEAVIVSALESLPHRLYQNAAEVVAALKVASSQQPQRGAD